MPAAPSACPRPRPGLPAPAGQPRIHRLGALPLALLLPAAPVSAAEESGAAQALPAVTVTGRTERNFTTDAVQVGAFRDQTVLDTPLTVQIITRDLIDAQGGTSLHDAVRNSAGVTRVQLGGAAYDNLAIRGIPLENRANYRLNGTLPLINLVEIPLEDKQRVEVLKGVSALYYGFVTPSGVINLVTKRAGSTPVTAFELRGDDKGGWNVYADVARRFGAEQQFGARLGLSEGRVETGQDGAGGPRRFASAALDWRATPALNFKLDLSHVEKTIAEPAGIQLLPAVDGRITLPRVPDPDRALTNTSWQRTRAKADNVLLRTEWSINERWAATLDVGRAETERRRVFSQFGPYDLETGDGTLSTQLAPGQRYSNNNLRVELAGLVPAGSMSHELLFGYTRNKRYQAGPIAGRVVNPQNLYDPVEIPESPIGEPSGFNPSTIVDESVYAMDRVRFENGLQVLAGLRYGRYESRDRVDGDTTVYRKNTLSPSLGLIWALDPKLNVYASYIEGLEETGRAPEGTENEGDALRPARSKQIEIGVKGEHRGWHFGTALFRIERAQAYTEPDSNRYVLDGRTVYQGVELSLNGEVLPRTAIYGTAMLLDAEQRDTAAGAQDGLRPENTPKTGASVFVEHRLGPVPGLAINAGAYYTGHRSVNALNQAEIGSVTIYNAGARYKTAAWFGKETTLALHLDNLTDKRYWSAAGNRLLAVGSSRTARVSLQASF